MPNSKNALTSAREDADKICSTLREANETRFTMLAFMPGDNGWKEDSEPSTAEDCMRKRLVMSEIPYELLSVVEHYTYGLLAPPREQPNAFWWSEYRSLESCLLRLRVGGMPVALLRLLEQLDMLRYFPSDYISRLFKVLLSILEVHINSYRLKYYKSREVWVSADRWDMGSILDLLYHFLCIHPHICQITFDELNYNGSQTCMLLRLERMMFREGDAQAEAEMSENLASFAYLRVMLGSFGELLGVKFTRTHVFGEGEGDHLVGALARRRLYAELLGEFVETKKFQPWKQPGKSCLAVCLYCGSSKVGQEGFKQYRPCKNCAIATYCGQSLPSTHRPCPTLILL